MPASNHSRRLLQITALLSFLVLCAPNPTRARADARHNKRTTAGVTLRIGLIRLFGRVSQVAIAAPPGARLTGTSGAVRASVPVTWTFGCGSDGRVVVCQNGTTVLTDSVVRVCPPDDATPLAIAASNGTLGQGNDVGHGREQRLRGEQRYRGVLEIGVRSSNGAGGLSIV